MISQVKYELDRHEQLALAQSALDCPLTEIAADSIDVESFGEGRVIVRWSGARIIPIMQLEAVVAEVAAERATNLENRS